MPDAGVHRDGPENPEQERLLADSVGTLPHAKARPPLRLKSLVLKLRIVAGML
jgi:hypothetical protein